MVQAAESGARRRQIPCDMDLDLHPANGKRILSTRECCSWWIGAACSSAKIVVVLRLRPFPSLLRHSKHRPRKLEQGVSRWPQNFCPRPCCRAKRGCCTTDALFLQTPLSQILVALSYMLTHFDFVSMVGCDVRPLIGKWQGAPAICNAARVWYLLEITKRGVLDSPVPFDSGNAEMMGEEDPGQKRLDALANILSLDRDTEQKPLTMTQSYNNVSKETLAGTFSYCYFFA